MTQSRKIFAIKFIHSVIFFFMVACLLYIIYCTATRTYNWALVIAMAAIFGEGLALLLNRWRCPITTFTEKYGAGSGAVVDIFMPAWLSRHTFTIGTTVFVLALIGLAIGYFLL